MFTNWDWMSFFVGIVLMVLIGLGCAVLFGFILTGGDGWNGDA